MTKQTDSPAIAFLRHVWKESMKATRHSWQRLNHSMYGSLRIAIASGMQFGPDDFTVAFREFRGEYWNCYGSDRCEEFFTVAVGVSNTSAIKAFEKWAQRRPFLVDTYRYRLPMPAPVRATVGRDFVYGGKIAVRVTSFTNDGHLIACTYKPCKKGEYRRKIAKRFRISHQDIYADRAARKAASKAACDKVPA